MDSHRPETVAGLTLATVSPALVEEIYDELRAIARRALRTWRPGHSLQATALVHEAWLRMERQAGFGGLDKSRFLALAALSIRRILIEHYRAATASSRGPAAQRVPLFDSILIEAGPTLDILALHEALEALARIDARQAQVVELRFFGGLGEREVADVLAVSLRTVSADWQYARAWLALRLRSGGPA